MKFKIPERKTYNSHKYSKEDFDLAKRFSEAIQKELGMFLKAVILFGSSARTHKSPYERDVDILLIVNDLTVMVSQEVISAYRIITEDTARKVSKRLHITTLKLTSFWEYMRNGDPIAVNMLRDGVPLFDSGFFGPMQVLLHQGRIRPTKESVWVYYSRAPTTLLNSRWHLLQATVDLYWAVIDAAHAALMHVGATPPSPAHVAKMMEQKLVKRGLITKKYANTMDFFFNLSKKITHKQIVKISGKEYDSYYKQADDFVKKMRTIIEIKKFGK